MTLWYRYIDTYTRSHAVIWWLWCYFGSASCAAQLELSAPINKVFISVHTCVAIPRLLDTHTSSSSSSFLVFCNLRGLEASPLLLRTHRWLSHWTAHCCFTTWPLGLCIWAHFSPCDRDPTKSLYKGYWSEAGNMVRSWILFQNLICWERHPTKSSYNRYDLRLGPW